MHIDVLLYLLADLVAIILAARAFGMLARKVGQPAVVGEVLAGIMLGPTVLGRFWPAGPGLLFPTSVPLKEIADLGLVFFMFLVGLELDPRLIKQEGRRAFLISICGIIGPLVLGMAAAFAIAPVNASGKFLEGVPHPPTTLSFALFLGAAMCITAFPILARILVETGLYKVRFGILALCAAAVDDAIAWILLAGVVGITKSGSAAQALPVFGLTLLFVGFMATAGRKLLGLLSRRYDEVGRLSLDQTALILSGVLLSAWCTEIIGIHAIFGAFIFGAIMPKGSGMTHELTDKVEDFTVVVLLPVFFAVTGLRTNLLSINSPSLIGWMLLIVTAATLGKLAGTGLASWATGSSKRDSLIIGALMNTRGLTELVILTIGLNLGVLSDVTFAMMVVMALATTLMAAPIVSRLISREEQMRLLVESSGGAPVQAAPAVRILAALGNPLNAPYLVDVAIRMLGNQKPAELLLVRLVPTPRAAEFRTGLLDEESQVGEAVESMRPLVEQAAAAGVVARPISFLTDDVAPDLARIAADQKCVAIVLGWHRASLARHLIQRLVHRVFELAECDVVVFVDRAGKGIRRVEGDQKSVLVVQTVGPHDAAAARVGRALATGLGASMRLLGLPPREFVGGVSEELSRRADAVRQEQGIWVTPVIHDRPHDEVLIEESADAAATVLPVGDDWEYDDDFGANASKWSDETSSPTLVVRGAETAAARATSKSHHHRATA